MIKQQNVIIIKVKIFHKMLFLFCQKERCNDQIVLKSDQLVEGKLFLFYL